jgi:hypothetical protein
MVIWLRIGTCGRLLSSWVTGSFSRKTQNTHLDLASNWRS